jgi:23S rRNA (uracil1939-C5)-methyltransferase
VITHKIIRLGHQGDGIAEGPVFAARTLPGEVVSGTPEGTRLRDVRIVTSSGDRVAAPCRHYRACGGCQLQHAGDAFVAAWKISMVETALAAQGLVCDMRAIATSPPRSRRRAVLAARRTKKGALVGFHGAQSGTITEIPDCLLLDPALIPAIEAARQLAIIGASRKATLAVSATLSGAGLDLSVGGGKPLDGPLRAVLGQAAATLGLARLDWDGEAVAMGAPPVQVFGDARVVPPPGAFLQATPQGEAALVLAVAEILGDAGRVADLFAGCGTFALPLARTAQVHAVEGEAAMIDALDRGWRNAPGLKRVTTEVRDLFRRPLLAEECGRFDAVVLDPPRAGAEAQIAELAQARVPVIAYVSCNPTSFARDAAYLVGVGYDLDWVQVVDQFRWSVHTELAAAFRVRVEAAP